MALSHQGSWGVGGFKLPDFGVTEAIGRTLNKPTTPQGGSNLFGKNTQVVAPSKPQGGQGQIKGATAPAVSGGYSGGGGGGYVAPQQQSFGGDQGGTDYGAYQSEQENLLNGQINEAYNPAFSALDRMEQDYKTQFPTAQQEITQSFDAVKPEIEKEQTTELAGITTQRQKGATEKESQIAKARRLANELRQSNLTRFGGASSTGEASNELLNRTTAEQFGDINTKFGDYNQNLDKEETQVNNYFTKKLSDLEQEKQLKLRTLQDKFDSTIRQINGNRADLESQKAAKRLGALQELSSSIQQMKAQDTQFKQELELWKQYKDEAINTARQFNAKSFTVPGFKNVFDSFSITGANTGGGGISNPLADATGSFNQEEEEPDSFQQKINMLLN